MGKGNFMNLQFKNIETDDIEKMMPFYSMRKNKTCDSVFLESFIWKDFYKVRYAIWEEKAILWLMEYGGNVFSAMPLCREEDLPAAFKAIENYFNEELGFPLVINLADEYAVNYLKLPETEYFVEEQVDSKDYLYDGNAMRTLAGKKLHKKKNHINGFLREYGDRTEYRALCCSDGHEVWEFLDRWREKKGDEVEEHLDYEVQGIHDILKNCCDLYVHMGGVFIDGVMEAFTMGSYNPIENMAVIHIEKANPDIRGLYQYVNQQFLLAEFPSVDWVNREDDMGLEGLRAAKMSYYPADYARKYLVEQIVDGKHGYKWAEEIGNTIAGEELLYLSGLEAEETKKLWREAFPDDSEQFVEYYYSEKVKDNRLLIKMQNGFLVSMAHLNPYQMQVKDSEWDIGYIVGVATEESKRRNGHMGDILKKLLNDIAESGGPFTFLMPADEAIYLPFGFSYICRQPVLALKASVRETLNRRTCSDTLKDCEAAAEYMEQWLSVRYQVYCKRDAGYVSRLLKELASEDGSLEFLYDGQKLIGLEAFWGLKEKEQRLLYAEDAYVEEAAPAKPAIMARITSLEHFLTAFSAKEGADENMALELQVRDPLIEKNNGRFLWSFAEQETEITTPGADEGLRAAELEKKEDRIPVLRADIQDLAVWLFGYKKPEEIWPEAGEELMTVLRAVDTANKVFIDEVV